MSSRIAATAPILCTADDAVDAIIELGPHVFPEKVHVDDADGMSLGEKVSVSLARLATYTWSVAFSPVGHSRLLPRFDGRMTLVRSGAGLQLILRGAYEPPLGWFGTVADHLLGERVARRSVARFLHEAAERIDRTARERRESGPMRSAPYPPDLRHRHWG